MIFRAPFQTKPFCVRNILTKHSRVQKSWLLENRNPPGKLLTLVKVMLGIRRRGGTKEPRRPRYLG